MLITDGSSQDRERTIKEAVKLRVAGVTILTVAVGGWLNEEELQGVTTDPDNVNIIRARRYSDLGTTMVETLKAAICNGKISFN